MMLLSMTTFEKAVIRLPGRLLKVGAGPADGEVILMLHRQPSWSFLCRKMMPALADANYRVIAADHIGMGRSHKPVDRHTPM